MTHDLGIIRDFRATNEQIPNKRLLSKHDCVIYILSVSHWFAVVIFINL